MEQPHPSEYKPSLFDLSELMPKHKWVHLEEHNVDELCAAVWETNNNLSLLGLSTAKLKKLFPKYFRDVRILTKFLLFTFKHDRLLPIDVFEKQRKAKFDAIARETWRKAGVSRV